MLVFLLISIIPPLLLRQPVSISYSIDPPLLTHDFRFSSLNQSKLFGSREIRYVAICLASSFVQTKNNNKQY